MVRESLSSERKSSQPSIYCVVRSCCYLLIISTSATEKRKIKYCSQQQQLGWLGGTGTYTNNANHSPAVQPGGVLAYLTPH